MSTFCEKVSFANNKINLLMCPLKCEEEHTTVWSLVWKRYFLFIF